MSILDIEDWGHFVHGQWVKNAEGNTLINYSPSDDSKIGTLARGDNQDIERAIESSEKAYIEWSNLDPYIRGQHMINYANHLRKNKNEIGKLETLDTGKPLNVSIRTVETAARYLEYYGGYADKLMSEVIPTSGSKHAYTLREPYGIVLNIMPWNSPITGIGKGVGAAIAAGNVVIVKSSEFASLAALYMAKLAVDSGMPPGVFNVLTGFGEEVGQSLVNNKKIKKIAFTGSVDTGVKIMTSAAKEVVPVTLELGGKSPNIIFEDAELEKAAAGSVKAFVANTGQICSSGTRILVHKSIKDEFEKLFIKEVEKVKVGLGEDNPDIGPIVTKSQYEKVIGYIKKGQDEGAKLLYGGRKIQEEKLKNGYFIEPTVFTNVKNDMAIAQEEIFGPVVSIISFDNESEAIEIANDIEYGLASGVWSKDISRINRVIPKIEAGNVYINGYQGTNVEVPFGGYKKSGIGRDRGLESVLDHTQLKSVVISYD